MNSGEYNLTAEYVVPSDAPGLFNLDTCVVTQMSFVPGAREYLVAGNGNSEYITYSDPCVCANFISNGMNFSDYATKPVVASVTTNYVDDDCLDKFVPKLNPPSPFP